MAVDPQSTFEIDDDANLTQDNASPSKDWLTSGLNALVVKDEPTGRDDDSYSGGVKEDTACPSETTGSIPNNKSDLRTYRVYEEPGTGSHPGWLNIAWSRVTDPSGTTLMDFEFNQSKEACSTGPNRVRTTGDLLVEYLIDQGGARAAITLRRWTGSAWSAPEDLTTPSATCGNAPCAVGTINSTPISAADSGLTPGEALAARTFGEARIDLRTIFKADKCTSFGSAMLKSRSSDSFTSQLKDFIAPQDITLTNCGTVIIRKQTDPDKAAGSFAFTKSFATDPTTTNTFNLSDGDAQTFNNVLFGSGLTVNETGLEPGFTFKAVDCSASTGVVPSISGSTVTFAIDNKADILDCTYTNEARAKFTVKKVIDPSTSSATFTFTPGTGLSGSAFSLGHDGTQTFADLAPGSVSIAETVPATGWDLTDIVCTKQDGPDAGTDPDPVTNSGSVASATATVSLAAGDDVTCTFSNRQRASILIVKTDDAGDPLTGAQFTVYDPDDVVVGSCTTALVDQDPGPEVDNRAECTVGNLVPGVTYTVKETVTPDGYQTAPDQTATPGPGQTVTLTFVDKRLFTIVTFVCSEWDNQLYSSDISFDDANAITLADALPSSIGSEDISISEAALCALINSRAEGKTADQLHTVTVDIP